MLLVNYLWSVLPKDKCTFSVMLRFLMAGMNSPWSICCVSSAQCLTPEKLVESFWILGELKCVVLGVVLVLFGFIFNLRMNGEGDAYMNCLQNLIIFKHF